MTDVGLTRSPDPIGFYVTCDDVECWWCHQPAEWPGSEGWDEPVAIFAHDEADSPTHCRRCGDLIEHNLTTDGRAYVRAAVEAGVVSALVGALTDHERAVLTAWCAAYLVDDDG